MLDTATTAYDKVKKGGVLLKEYIASYNIIVIIFQENHIKNLLFHKPYEIIGLVQIEVVVHLPEALSS